MGDQGTRPLSLSNQTPKEGGGGGGSGGGGGQSKSSEEKDMLDAMQTTKGVGGNGYYARLLKDHEFEGDGVLQLKKGSEVWIEHFAVDKNWSIVVANSGARGEC